MMVGCQHFAVDDISAIDTSQQDQSCIRQCSATYSNCIGKAFGISAQNACGNGYKACIQTCPAK
jgi:hypothetical protein